MQKKILITGMNREQCTRDFFLKKELKILNSHYSLIRCLEDMGWEVEQRPVEVGEDLSGYDEVIIYLHSIQAFCHHLYDGLYAIKARPNAIFAFDDWQVNQIMASFKQFRRGLVGESDQDPFRDYLLELYYGTSNKAKLLEHKADFIEACDVVAAKKNRLLVCAFAGGDLTKLRSGWPVDRMFQYDPNPYNMNRSPDNNYGDTATLSAFCEDRVLSEMKKREWVFASLVQSKTKQWLEKQQLKWPVVSYGARRGEHKTARVTEPDMCRVYDAHWGCLMPTYYHAGSGWWRSRVQQVIDVGSLLWCDREEAKVYGFDYLSAADIESRDVESLISAAAEQRERFYALHPLDKAVQRASIQRALEALH